MAQVLGDRNPYQAVIGEILALQKLAQGWDSYGAEPVNKAALLRAISLVNSFEGLGKTVPPPVIGASPDGAVILRWLTLDREVDIVFRETGGECTIMRRGTHDVLIERSLSSVDPLKDIVRAHVVEPIPLERAAR